MIQECQCIYEAGIKIPTSRTKISLHVVCRRYCIYFSYLRMCLIELDIVITSCQFNYSIALDETLKT